MAGRSTIDRNYNQIASDELIRIAVEQVQLELRLRHHQHAHSPPGSDSPLPATQDDDDRDTAGATPPLRASATGG